MSKFASLGGLLFCLFAAQLANAQPQGEGVRFGLDETVLPVAELSADQRMVFKEDTELDLSVGFAWRRAFLFHPGFAFWNWRGRYVLYDGGNVIEIPPPILSQLLGKEQFDQLSPPLAYRIPAGLATVIALILIAVAVNCFMPSQYARTQRLVKDPKYVQAIEVYNGSLPGPDEETTLELRRQALVTAVEFLVAEKSVPRTEAEANLKTIISFSEEQHSKYLRQQALVYEEAGDWDKALDLYEEAAELRELWDPKDYAYLQKCIARVEKKQAAA